MSGRSHHQQGMAATCGDSTHKSIESDERGWDWRMGPYELGRGSNVLRGGPRGRSGAGNARAPRPATIADQSSSFAPARPHHPPEKVTAVAGPYRSVDVYPPITFSNVDEVDLHYQAEQLQQQIRTPICLDESIHTVHAADEAIALGACRIINIKPGRVGGHGQSIRLHDLAAEHGIPVWHGGMLESGIGRAHNVHLSTLPNFTLPGDVADSKRYFVEELIEPTVQVRKDGTIAVPDGPGIGYDVKMDRVEKHLVSRRVLKPKH